MARRVPSLRGFDRARSTGFHLCREVLGWIREDTGAIFLVPNVDFCPRCSVFRRTWLGVAAAGYWCGWWWSGVAVGTGGYWSCSWHIAVDRIGPVPRVESEVCNYHGNYQKNHRWNRPHRYLRSVPKLYPPYPRDGLKRSLPEDVAPRSRVNEEGSRKKTPNLAQNNSPDSRLHARSTPRIH